MNIQTQRNQYAAGEAQPDASAAQASPWERGQEANRQSREAKDKATELQRQTQPWAQSSGGSGQ